MDWAEWCGRTFCLGCEGIVMEKVQPWQARILVEREELENKYMKLREFIFTGGMVEFNKLDFLERQRLVGQAYHMHMYLMFIDARIAAWGNL